MSKKAVEVIKNFLKQHYLALIFAIVVGLVSALPQFLAIRAIGGDYKGIHFMYTANEDVYMARIQEIIDGHWGVGSAFFYEYKNWNTLIPPIGEYFYAIPAILLHVSLPNILIASKLLFPAILFFLVYFLIYKLSNNPQLLNSKVNALVGGLFVTLGYDLIDYKNAIMILLGKKEMFILSLWTRPVNPITGALLIFTFLLLLWGMINNRRRFLFLPAGLVLGLMIGYFFSWALSFATVLILILIFVFKKNFWIVKNLWLTLLMGFLISAPYWHSVFSSLFIPQGRQISLKNGMLFTHQPMFNKVLLAITFIFLLCSLYEYFKKRNFREEFSQKKYNWWWFCLALILGGLLALNQQVVTGRTIWPYHFVQYTIPFAIIVGMVLLANCLKTRFFKLWIGTMILIFLSLVTFNISALKTLSQSYPDYRELQKYAGFFSWVNQNTPKDCVILVKEPVERITLLVPAFTHCDVYTAPWTFNGVPEERVLHNYLVRLRINGVSSEAVGNYIRENQSELRAYFFDDWRHLFSSSSDAWFEDLVSKITTDYQKFVQKDFVLELKRYRLDYIVAEEPPDNDLAGLRFIIKLDKLYLYQL